jgi:hypothetical protein
MMVLRRPNFAAGAGLACLICAGAQGCTQGTTPDCADAQCQLVSVVEGGEDAASGDAAEDTAAPEASSSVSDGGDAARD